MSRFEYNLLRILRFLVGHMPAEQAMNLIYTRLNPPNCISSTAMRLLEETLAKAVVLYLVRSGGWRDEQHLQGLKITSGRVWERITPEVRRLSFGPAIPDFLIWLTADNPTEPHEIWDIGKGEKLSAADELFFALALDSLKADPNIGNVLAKLNVVQTNALAWLMNAPILARAGVEPNPPDFEPWMDGTRAMILECLQPMLQQRWVRSERTKCLIEDWQLLNRLGLIEHAILSKYLNTVERAARPDLARFFLKTVSTILAPNDLSPSFWFGGLRGQGPQRLADRLAVHRSALAVPQNVETLHRWDRQARTVGFYDDEYNASQLWKSEWEDCQGEAIAVKARRLIEMVEPLR